MKPDDSYLTQLKHVAFQDHYNKVLCEIDCFIVM